VNVETLIAALYIFALAAFWGYPLISRAPLRAAQHHRGHPAILMDKIVCDRIS
jgi:hypothetical protein